MRNSFASQDKRVALEGREERSSRFSRIGWRGFSIAFCLALVFGCGSKSELYSARGKVYVEGKPAVGAIVVLHPSSEMETTVHLPSAQVDAAGSFTLEAPPGEYQVAVVWYDDVSQTNRVTGAVATKLNPRYGDPKTSSLRAEIGQRDNQLPAFNLTK